jgi:hypothetical protein
MIFIKKNCMVQPKYSPEEALQRVKLMMGYDLKKTLKENREIIFEQAESCPNNMPYEDIKELAETVGAGARDMTLIFSKMVNGDERARDILNAVKQVVGKNTYDDIDEKCVPAKDVFDKFFKKYSESLMGFSGGDNVSTTLNNLMKDSYVKNNFPEAIRMVAKAKQLWDTPAPTPGTEGDRQKNINSIFCSVKNGIIINPSSTFNNISWENWKTTYKPTDAEIEVAKKSCKIVGGGYKPCSGTYSYGCKSDVIAKVQGCLGGLVPDGKFGPKTKAKLSAKGFTSFTDADVEKICKTEEKLGSDVESQTLGQNQNDVDSNTNTPSNPNQQDLTTKTGIS